jgi:hypothetical protein
MYRHLRKSINQACQNRHPRDIWTNQMSTKSRHRSLAFLLRYLAHKTLHVDSKNPSSGHDHVRADAISVRTYMVRSATLHR